MLDFLKSLTSYLINKKDINELDLTKMSDRSIVDRILSYYYKYPYIIEYFDKYMNIQNYNLKEVLESIRIVGLSNGIDETNKLYFLKNSDEKDTIGPNIKKILFEYHKKTEGKYLNNAELKSLYNLYLNDIMTNEDISNMAVKIKYEKEISQKDPMNITSQKEDDIKIGDFEFPKIPKHIKQFCNDLKDGFAKRPECNKCKLFGNPTTILDTNMNDFGPVDVVFIALNPGKDEIAPSIDRPLVGRAGKYFRKYLVNFPPNLKWVMTNIIMCHTPNQATIGKTTKDVLDVAHLCLGNLKQVLNKFPSNFIVTMGGPAMELFKIKGSVKGNSGRIFDIKKLKIAPLPHPSAAMQYRGDNEESFELGIKVISEYLYSLEPPVEEETITLPDTVERKNEKRLYVNTVKLNDDRVLNIFLDENNKKILELEKNVMPVFVKVGNFNELGYLDEPTHICYVDGRQKRELDKLVKESIDLNKRKCFK